MSERPTGERGSSSWLTPHGDEKNPGPNGGHLTSQVKNEEGWPTPRGGNPGSRKPGTGGKILAEEAKKTWPTPNGAPAGPDYARANREGSGGDDLVTAVAKVKRDWNTPNGDEKNPGPNGGHLTSDVKQLEGKGQLNPAWVEALMGFPEGWTELDGPPPTDNLSMSGSRPASRPA